MKLNHEIIHFQSNLPIKLFVNRIGNVDLHWHQSIEICVILDGECNVNVAEKTYKLFKSDMILINSNTPHSFESENALLTTLQIRLDKLERVRDDIKQRKFDLNSRTVRDQKLLIPIKSIIAKLLKYNKQNSYDVDLLNLSLIYDLIFELYNNFITDEKNLNNDSLDRLTSILNYINNEYQNPISLQTLAEKEFLSTAYLSRYFKENVGMTFSDYLKNIRLSKAIETLMYEKISIDDVASLVGFPNTRSFVSAFKGKYNMLPSQFRNNQAYMDADINDIYTKDRSFNYLSSKLEAYDENQTNFIEKYSNLGSNKKIKVEQAIESKNISINEYIPKNITKNFKNMIGMSRCYDLLNIDVQNQIRIMQKEIGFVEIKIHSMFDDDMMVYSEINGKPYYNFNLIDKVYDFLFDVNLNPLIQLSFTPSLIASNPNKKIFLGKTNTSMPNIKKWNLLVESFILHLINKYGIKKVLTLKFTVWNEPSTSNDLFGLKDNEYKDLYLNTYNTIKRINPSILVGGPASFSCYGKGEKWLLNFLEFTKEKNVVPDFITIHYYDIDLSWLDEPYPDPANKGKVFLSTNPDSFSLFVSRVKTNLQAIGIDKDIYLTEWNNTVKHNDLVSDTIFKSAYVTKCILENYNDIKSFGYWLISDLHNENQLPAYLFHGGLGLFTYNGIKKPAYYAFFFLNQLGDVLIKKDKGYFVTKTDDGYAIILYNYIHYDNIYAKDAFISITMNKRYSNFDMSHLIEFNIDINDSGSYSVESNYINRSHGSAFDTCISLGDFDCNDLDPNYINKLSIYGSEFKTLNNVEHIQLSYILKPLEVRLIKIKKIYKEVV